MSTNSPVHVLGTKARLDEAFAEAPPQVSEQSYHQQDYRVNIPSFEGPLDLLLHLIRKDQIDIHNIPIAEICQSYLEYIEIMERPDVNLAGEFMVMAATLMYLKSLTLLPRDEDENGEDDPRAPLVAQLLEYEQFQIASKKIDARSWLNRDVFARPASASKDMIPSESLLSAAVEPVETYRLLVALKIAMDRTSKPALQVEVDPVSLRHKVVEIKEKLTITETAELAKFIPEQNCEKMEIIVAFLSVLELARLGFIEIMQHENFGPIQIRKVRSLDDLNLSLLNQF